MNGLFNELIEETEVPIDNILTVFSFIFLPITIIYKWYKGKLPNLKVL
jgi:hypothetical protein